jgi:hypothetical protein
MQLEEVAEPLIAEGGGGEQRPSKPPSRGAARRPHRPLSSARAMSVSGPHPDVPLDQEVAIIDAALHEHGSCNRRELGRRVGARHWGPGRFQAALREAVAAGAPSACRAVSSRRPNGPRAGVRPTLWC